MSQTSINAVLSATWWPEFLAVKDGLSWSVLAARFGTDSGVLQRALASTGGTKAAQRPGRKPHGLEAAGVAVRAVLASAAAEVLPTVPPSSADDVLGRLAGKQPDGEVASAAGVSVEEVKAYRRTNDIRAFLRQPPGMSAVLPLLSQVLTTAPTASTSGAAVVLRRTPAPGLPVQEVRRTAPIAEPPRRTPEPESPPNPSRSARSAPHPDGDQAANLGKQPNEQQSVEAGNRPSVALTADDPQAIIDRSHPASTPSARIKPTSGSRLAAFRAELGTVADQVIADRAGMSRRAVRGFRRELGIAAYDGFRSGRPPRPVMPVIAASAVAVPASDTAADEARSPGASTEASPAWSLAPAAGPLRSKPGPRSAIDAFAEMLGVVPDSVISALASVSADAVKQYRQRRGIKRFVAATVAGPAVAMPLFAQPPNADASSKAPLESSGLTASTPWTPEPVDKKPAAGVSQPDGTLGQAPRSGPALRTRISESRRPRPSQIDPFAHLVGVVLDREVADLAGVTVGNVQAWGVRRGIQAATARAVVPVGVPPLKPSRPSMCRRPGRSTPTRAREPTRATSPQSRSFRTIPATWPPP